MNNVDYNGNFVAQIVTALIGAMIGAASYLLGFFIEKYIIKSKPQFKAWSLVASIAIGAVSGLLSAAKIGKLLSTMISFMLEFISSMSNGDKIYEALICSFIISIASLCFSGGMSVGKINKYNKQFINRLKKNNWKIIKDGIKTFFKHIRQHLKKYLSNNAFVAIFGVGVHSMSKAAIKKVRYSY